MIIQKQLNVEVSCYNDDEIEVVVGAWSRIIKNDDVTTLVYAHGTPIVKTASRQKRPGDLTPRGCATYKQWYQHALIVTSTLAHSPQTEADLASDCERIAALIRTTDYNGFSMMRPV
jgi:hypothetical protein